MNGQIGEHFQSPIVDGRPGEVNGPLPGDNLWRAEGLEKWSFR
ncbi:hypothetical protein LJR234_005195 [Mesorhizobium amorphae]